jgi:release factor glutamine methyltransferase
VSQGPGTPTPLTINTTKTTTTTETTGTLQTKVRAAAQRLVACGLDQGDATIDAEVLARHALDWNRATYLARLRDPAPPELAVRLDPLLGRRCRREPVAQIIGVREFWGLEFIVTRDVLVPRPETELLVDTALELLGEGAGARIVDLGTGSGCLAVTLAHERRDADVTATDTSAAALAVARRNAARHGVGDRVDFRQTDWMADLTGPFDLIVSNPPYIPDSDLGTLPPEVRDHEPVAALAGGPDGLDPARTVIAAAARRLTPGGWLLLEIGAGQSGAVRDCVCGHPALELVETRPDLQGIPRAAVISRSR